MYDDKSWLEIRSEALEYVKNEEESIIKEWLDSIHYFEPVGYYVSYSTKTIEIYTTRIGVLIGKAGMNIGKLEVMLSNRFRGEWNVKLIEIRGGFVNV